MKKLILALILIALVIGGYRFVTSRKKVEEEKPLKITEIETIEDLSPTPESLEETESLEEANKDLPSAGLSSEEKPIPSQEELERLIKEFESEE